MKLAAALRRNPVRVYAVLVSLVPLAQAYGVSLHAPELLGFAAAVLGVGEAVRSKVTPS